MDVLETLLDKRWILKSEDKEAYYQIRDGLGEVRKFISDKTGCQIVENSLLVKLEKIPPFPEVNMGIMDFTSKEEYAFLCVLLMFLEDKDSGEQFILSQLTEYIQGNMPGESLDWTIYTNRRRLIKVLRYSVASGLIKVTDGTDEGFMDDSNAEVLYENTGVSRYFTRSFSRNIMDYEKPSDFQETEYYGIEEDRGFARRQRVYKRLLFSPGVYRNSGSSEDFEYLKNYGKRLTADLENVFSCRVHIHHGSAYMLLDDDCHLGNTFPGNNTMSDIIMLCCKSIRNNIVLNEDGWERQKDETVIVDEMNLHRLIRDVKEKYSKGFTKKYREMPEGEFVKEVLEQMEFWSFIGFKKNTHQIIIYPSAGKITGRFPNDFVKEKEDE